MNLTNVSDLSSVVVAIAGLLGMLWTGAKAYQSLLSKITASESGISAVVKKQGEYEQDLRRLAQQKAAHDTQIALHSQSIEDIKGMCRQIIDRLDNLKGGIHQ